MSENRYSPWQGLSRGAILLGIVCLVAGLAARHIMALPTTAPRVLAPLIAGGVLALAGILLNLKWLWGLMRQRRFLVGLNVWAMITLSVVLLVIANAIVLATPRTDGWFIDLTHQGIHTLSPQSRNILSGLSREVKITVFYGTGTVNSGAGQDSVDITRRMQDLMRLYRMGGVKTEWVDIYADKTRAQQLAAALKMPIEPDSLVIQSGDQRRVLTFRELLEITIAYGALPTFGGFQGEEKITSAISALTDMKQVMACFLTGHGELAPQGAEGKALNKLSADLLRDNFKIQTLNLEQSGGVPTDCDLVIIAGPTAPFRPETAEKIGKFLDKGGKLLLAVKPRAAGGSIAGLEPLLSQYNLQISDDQLVIEVGQDVRSGAAAGSISFYAPFNPAHTITKEMGALNGYVQAASPVSALIAEATPGAQQQVRSDWTVTALLATSAQGWGESDINQKPSVVFDPGRDRKGPVSVAAAVSRRAGAGAPSTPGGQKARIVALGSTSIIADGTLDEVQANRTFALNCINWLTQRETHLGIPPQRPERHEMTANAAAMRAIFLLTVLAMPLTAGAFGIFIWWWRRR